MHFPLDIGGSISNNYHAVVVFNPAANCRRNTYACGDTRDHTGCDAEIAQDRIQRRVTETTVPLLDNQMLTLLWPQFVKDLCTPGPLNDELRVAGPIIPPVWKRRV